jgi:hypothetical protein
MPDDLAALRRDIDIDNAWRLVTDFATMPREDPHEANLGAEHLASRLRALGLPVEMHRPELFLSLPVHAEVRLGGAVLAAKVPAFAASRPEGVRGRLLHVPGGKLAHGQRLDGHIVLTEGFSLPNTVAALEAAGALGVIAINPGERIHWGTVSTIWGTPGIEDVPRLPRIASAAVNRADGDRLLAAAAAGGEAVLATRTRDGWFPSCLPVVRIPGSVEPENFVLLHGHYDSWQVGVGDNGTGNACLLEVARLLWQRRHTLRRSVWIAWWPGHSTGRYGGSTWFADTFARELDEHCVVQMNCDSPGCRWATSYESVTLMPETAAAMIEVVREVTGQKATAKHAARNSDWSFNNIGLSGAFMASSMIPEAEQASHGYSYRVGGCGGNIAWHTEDDTLEIADAGVLAADIALYATAALRFANATVLPLDWRATLSAHGGALAEAARDGSGLVDLSPAEEARKALLSALDAFHARAGAMAEGKVNALLMALGRILVPLGFTRGPRFTHDPALNVPLLPCLSAAAQVPALPERERGFAAASLLRGRNRVEAAYRAAARLLADA